MNTLQNVKEKEGACTPGVCDNTQGIAADQSGAKVFIPIKKPRNGKLTDEQKLYNKKLSGKRVIVKSAIGAAKHFLRISSIYKDSFERFNCKFQIAANIINFRHMLRNNTYERWSQKLKLLNSDKGREY